MKPTAAETPMAFIRAIVAAYRRYGKDPRPALQAAQIEPAQLRQTDARVTAVQMELMSERAMRELDDEAPGWFSRPLPWGSHGMLCRASLLSADLGVALARWCRHLGLLTREIRLELTVDAQAAQLTVHEATDLGEQRELCLVTTLRNIHAFACWIIDSRIPLVRASFPYPAPRHAKAYEHMFRGPVDFDAPHAGFSFDPEYLKLPVRRDDADLRQMLQRALPLVVLQYRRDRLMAKRIRDLLRTQGQERWNADDLADALHLSTRSLFRHLAEEGVTLQQLKDEVRKELAIHQLVRTRKSFKQVAVAAGFGSEASFNRAFRQWTGQTPGEYRAAMGRTSP